MRILKQGVISFTFFFTIIVFAKLLNTFLIGDRLFKIDDIDLYIASIGFILVVLVELLKKVEKNYSHH